MRLAEPAILQLQHLAPLRCCPPTEHAGQFEADVLKACALQQGHAHHTRIVIFVLSFSLSLSLSLSLEMADAIPRGQHVLNDAGERCRYCGKRCPDEGFSDEVCKSHIIGAGASSAGAAAGT